MKLKSLSVMSRNSAMECSGFNSVKNLLANPKIKLVLKCWIPGCTCGDVENFLIKMCPTTMQFCNEGLSPTSSLYNSGHIGSSRVNTSSNKGLEIDCKRTNSILSF